MPTSFWSGAVSFGLVTIPVRLYPATEPKDVHFHLLHRHDNSRIVQRYYCPADGELLEWHQLVRGYEVSTGRYVALTEEDLAAVPIKSLHAIEIDRFIKLSEIDPVHFQQTYYLAPDEELGEKPFALLLHVMRDSGKAAVGRFTLRNKEHACVLRAYQNVIALSPLLYPDEVRSTEALKKPAGDEIDEATLALAKQYIEALR